MSFLKYYVLVNNLPVEVAPQDWADRTEADHKINVVKQESVGEAEVSTILLPIGRVFSGLPTFETMVFGGKHDMYEARCSTYDQALQQHADAVKMVSEVDVSR
jgi:hypothetical protein